MYNLQNLEFVKVIPTQRGIFSFAKYPNWCQEYNFLIELDGRVKGRTSDGVWLELSEEISTFVQAKVRAIFFGERNLIYNLN